MESLARTAGSVPGIRNIRVKPAAFREECKRWQTAGRAGFCDYRYRHVIPLLDLEELNRELYRRQKLALPIQVVGAGDERYISNGQLVALAAQQSKTAPTSVCFMPDDVPHEMLSQYENLGRDMYWLEELLQDSVAFIVKGRFIPSASFSANQNSPVNPLCQIGTKREAAITEQPDCLRAT
jgi:hypothetical protein